MDKFFLFISESITNSQGISALLLVFLWGMLSVPLSPCHLASIPLIVGFVSEQGANTTKRAFAVSLCFSLGILITIALIAVITAAVGGLLGNVGPFGNYFVAVVFFLVGLHLLGVIPALWSAPGKLKFNRKGYLAAFVLGLIFGIALGPCTFAFMAPVIAVTGKLSAQGNHLYAAVLMAIYGLGHCGVIVMAGTSTELVQKYMNWNEKSKGSLVVRKICGVCIIAAGLYMLSS